MPDRPLRILIVEDTEVDYHLLVHQLHESGLQVLTQRVCSRAQMRAALEQDWDAILSDYHLPGFSGLEALELHLSTGRDLPFIFVSGTTGEEAAVRCMKAGAHDFVVKGHHRLIPALKRELEDAAHRRAHSATEDRLRTLVENTCQGLWITDPRGILLFANRRLDEILSCSDRSLVGRHLHSLFPESQLLEVHRYLAPPFEPAGPLQTRLSIHPQRVAEVLMNVQPLRNGELLGMVTDVTQLRTLESKLVQFQKMEAVGRLAAGIAHDFNNTLSIIQGYAGLLREEIEHPQQLESVDCILSVVQKSTSLTRQMLALGRQEELAAEEIQVFPTILDMRPFLNKVLGSSIDLAFRSECSDDVVIFDPDKLLQILLNLVINARDAIEAHPRPDGGRGKIVISTQRVVLDAATAVSLDDILQPGPHVVIWVSDNGCGMDAGVRQRIFEPFFTTKPKGSGSGLGLAGAYGSVRQCGGHIWVYSEVGLGTTFKIYLPAVHPSPPEPPLPTRPSGEHTILLLDDCSFTLNFIRTILEGDGYCVVAVHDTLEAEAFLERSPRLPELIVSDVLMHPGPSGPEFIKRLASRHKKLRSRSIPSSAWPTNRPP